MAGSETIKRQTSVVLVIENSLCVSVEFDSIVKQVLIPYIDAISSKYIGEKLVLGAMKKQLYGVVTCCSDDNLHSSNVAVSKIFSTPEDIKLFLPRIVFKPLCRGGTSFSCMESVIGKCKTIFSKIQTLRKTNEASANHLFFVVNGGTPIASSVSDMSQLKHRLKELKEEFSLYVSVLNLYCNDKSFFPEIFFNTAHNRIKLSDKHSQDANLILEDVSIPMTQNEVLPTSKKQALAIADVSSDEPVQKKPALAINAVSSNVNSTSESSNVNFSMSTPIVAAYSQNTAPPSKVPVTVPTYSQAPVVTAAILAKPVTMSNPVSVQSEGNASVDMPISSNPTPTKVSVITPANVASNRPVVAWSGIMKLKAGKSRAYGACFLVDPNNPKSEKPRGAESWPSELTLQMVPASLQEFSEFCQDAIQLPCQFYHRLEEQNCNGDLISDQDPLIRNLQASVSIKQLGCISMVIRNTRLFMLLITPPKKFNYHALIFIPNKQNEFMAKLRELSQLVKMKNQQQAQQQQQNLHQQSNAMDTSVGTGTPSNIPVSVATVSNQYQMQQQQMIDKNNPSLQTQHNIHLQNNPAQQPLSQLASLANNTVTIVGGSSNPNSSLGNSGMTSVGQMGTASKHVPVVSAQMPLTGPVKISNQPQGSVVRMQTLQTSNLSQNQMKNAPGSTVFSQQPQIQNQQMGTIHGNVSGHVMQQNISIGQQQMSNNQTLRNAPTSNISIMSQQQSSHVNQNMNAPNINYQMQAHNMMTGQPRPRQMIASHNQNPQNQMNPNIYNNPGNAQQVMTRGATGAPPMWNQQQQMGSIQQSAFNAGTNVIVSQSQQHPNINIAVSDPSQIYSADYIN